MSKKQIKVNIPRTEKEFLEGNGTGVWVLVDPETFRDYANNVDGGVYVGILDDICGALNPCDAIFFTMRGANRPVALFDTLPSNGFTDTRKKEVLKELLQGSDKNEECDAYKVAELEKMLAEEGAEEHYGARLHYAQRKDIKVLTIDAGGLQALIDYYKTHDTHL